MKATNLADLPPPPIKSPITSHSADDDKPIGAPPPINTTVVCVRDKEARMSSPLRPLGANVASESRPAAAAAVSSGAGLATTASASAAGAGADVDESQSSRGSDADDVKNSIHRPQIRPGSSSATPTSRLIVVEPDRASLVELSPKPMTCLQQRRHQQQQQDQTKHGNQTGDESDEKGAAIIVDSLGSMNGSSSSFGAMSSPDGYLDRGKYSSMLLISNSLASQRASTNLGAIESKVSEISTDKSGAEFQTVASKSDLENCELEHMNRLPKSNAEIKSMSESVASSGGELGGDDIDAASETIATMHGSQLAALEDVKSSYQHLWSPANMMQQQHLNLPPWTSCQSSYEADTLRLIQALNKQRHDLQDMDRQLSLLIAGHLRSIGLPDNREMDYWCASGEPFVAKNAPNDADRGCKIALALPEPQSEECNQLNQVIDLTVSRRIIPQENQNDLEVRLQLQRVDLKQSISAREQSRIVATAKVGENLGQFTSLNLRKSRLLGAKVDASPMTQQAIAAPAAAAHAKPAGAFPLISPPNNGHGVVSLTEPPHNDHDHTGERDKQLGAACSLATAFDEQQQQQSSRRESGKRSPEMMSSAVGERSPLLTRDVQQFKRLKLSPQTISSSGAYRDSPTAAAAAPAANCNSGSQLGDGALPLPPTAESNVDLLRDFMLHNQYLPSHLVLECLSQCQKQTSAFSSLSSMLSLPFAGGDVASATSFIGASSPTSSAASSSSSSTSASPSTARNQTKGHNSPQMDCHRQIDQLDMGAHQRGSGALAEFNRYYAHANAVAASVSAAQDGSGGAATTRPGAALEHQHQPARGRAFVAATSHLDQNNLDLLVSHHHHHHHRNNNNSSSNSNYVCRPPSVVDDHQFVIPTARHNNMQHTSQETLQLLRATMGINHHQLQLQLQQQQQQQHYHHHHHPLISMADIQRVAFKCHVCGSGFEDRHRLQQHLSIHLNLQASWFEEKTITETMAQYESKRGDYLCGHCDIRFETTAEFDKHMQTHGDKPHRCDLCSQDNKLVSFRYYRQLLTHLRSHCFLYSCRFAPECKQTSNRKDYLKLHILKHHLNNQLPKQYTICCH